jgi:hypothetical protein
MTNMLSVFNRMTVWAKNFQVLHAVVRPIAVFMMNAKNICICIKTASLTRIQQASSFHVLANSAEIALPIFNCGLVNASSGAVFSFFRWGRKKFCFAVQTSVLNSAFGFHRRVVTGWAAILSFVGSAGNMLEDRFANFASCFLKRSDRQCHTASATKQSAFFSVFRYKKLFVAMLAKLFILHSGAHCATHT